MRVVHKFPLEVGVSEFDLCDPVIRHVGQDPSGFDDIPCMWIERDPNGRATHRIIVRWVGTGHSVPDGYDFAGTAVLKSSGLVWHVYTKTRTL